jgi:peptidoglycan hydrolase-like protein with peptidoglycan-binding domain
MIEKNLIHFCTLLIVSLLSGFLLAISYTSSFAQESAFNDTINSIDVVDSNQNASCDPNIAFNCTSLLTPSPLLSNIQDEQQFQQEQTQQQPEDIASSQEPDIIQQPLQPQEQQDQFFASDQQIPSQQGIIGAPTSINLNDTDGDDLLDVWETTGMDLDNDGVVELDLKKLGADPNHKDLFVEVDFMQLHKPFNQSITHVINNFSNAPVTNPDGSRGIKLHVEVDEEIPHQNDTDSKSLVLFKATNFGTSAQRANPATILAKSLVYHYALFAHNQPGSESSGQSNGINSMEFITTLGGRVGFLDPMTRHPVGSPDFQEGTFMHELGHNLGLNHGGNDIINCKPNYLSVMSHVRQMSIFLGTRPLDYSRSTLFQLDERALDENNGVSTSTPPGLLTVYGPSPPNNGIKNNTGIPLDWNRDGDTVDTVPADINFIKSVPDCNPNAGGNNSTSQVLNGFDDWNQQGAGLIFSQPARDLKQFLSTISNPLTNTVIVPASIIRNTFGVDITNSSSAALASDKILEISRAIRTSPEEMPPELTMEDVRQSRVAHLESLNQLINLLPESAFLSGTAPSPPEPVVSCDPLSPLLLLDLTGEKVTELQTLLTTLGYGQLLGPSGIDGIFGPFTENAVKQYQEDHQLLVDGKVGPETWTSICSSINSQQQIPVGQIGDPRSILLGITDPQNSELARLLLSDKLDESVNLLLQLRSLTDGSVGENAENDLIVSPEAQSQFLSILDNAIVAIEKQGPGYDEQGNFRSSLPANSTIFTEQEQAAG